MNQRNRHEQQIELGTYAHNGFDTFEIALQRTMSRYRGLNFFTDEQIAEIRAEMIERAWTHHRLDRTNRKRFARLHAA